MSGTSGTGAAPQVIQGREVKLPCEVRDAGSASVIFGVPATVAQRFVGPALEVVEMAPGLTQLVVGFVDYRDNDLGNYNEAMIVFMVRPRGHASGEGTFIYKLPVNQSFTCEAGRRIWGFPKTIERIEVDYAPDNVSGRLVMDGQPVFDLSVPRRSAEAVDTPDLAMTTYTYRDGLCAVPFTTGGQGTTVVPGGEGVRLTLGTHPLAGELADLGLPEAPPLLSTWMEHMHGTFDAPQRIGGS